MRWRGIVIYLLLLATLLSVALIKRHVQFRSLCRQLTSQISQLAESGTNDDLLLGEYFYGSYNSHSANPWTGSVQGPAIFLLKRSYMDDALARAVLLTEARRLNDWQYTYASVYNYDLRRYLIERCLRAFPDDLRVAWASGALSLAAGDDALALEQLARIIGGAEQWPACVGLCNQLNVSPEHMLGRYCAALTLHGRDAEAEQLLLALQANDHNAAHCYLRYLADCSRYDELMSLATDPDYPYRPSQLELYTWMYEQALHDRDWLRIRTTGREKTRLRLRDLERKFQEYYLGEPWVPESAMLAALHGVGPEQIGSLKFNRYGHLKIALRTEWRQQVGDTYLDSVAAPLATLFGLTGDQRWLAPLLELLSAPGRLDEEFLDSDRQTICFQLARAYCLRSEYDRANVVLNSLGKELSDNSNAASLLVALAQNKLSSLTDNVNEDDRWNNFDSGPNHLREGDGLVALLRSPQFTAALKHSGKSLDQVLPEIRAVTQPYRDTYYDSSNGELLAIRKQLNLPTQ